MMNYISIDLETTGLDETENQILEFGAVVDAPGHTAHGMEFRRLIANPDPLVCNPFALLMNVDLLREIEKRRRKVDSGGEPVDAEVCSPGRLLTEFTAFLCAAKLMTKETPKVVVAGKNFIGFDLKFLKANSKNWEGIIHRRALDPAGFFVDWETDTELPNLPTCCERAGIDLKAYHTAVGDAKMVIDLIRVGTNRPLMGGSE